MISKRLKEIASLVEDNSAIVDIGCDHGLLDVYLYYNKKNVKITATDISAKTVEKAINNFKKYGLNNLVDVKMSNGLDILNQVSVDTIIVAGLGGRNIIKLLEKDKLNNIRNIIIQPNNSIDEVRKYMAEIGYYIAEERLVVDNKHIYTIILFKFC